ncbi:unnamed protein product [Paramecium primaurelia]|uniref:Uncharacterized protein n=1 Tax=Paramecium primaurelia TaxID=5886 RepID=A0A8S1N4S5_PARPR|nr:unnamed protein product [Paramecium primaurelia]
MKPFLLVLLLASSGLIGKEIIVGSDYECECLQMMLQDDCLKQGCQWQNGECKVKLRQGAIHEGESESFCSQFDGKNCSSQSGCAFLVDKCVEFSACSSYLQSTNELCQSISKKCITDGEKCVEISVCSDYKTAISCREDTEKNYCYWENGSCSKSLDCGQLPKTLKNDGECRSVNSDCTVSSQGGCQLSGLNCQNQEGEQQCVWDRFMQVRCNWNGISCVDRSCQSAPISIKNNEECNSYLKGCILTVGGGCVELRNCIDITTSEACVVDKNGKQCYWKNEECVERVCSNASELIRTFEECQIFLNGCVPSLKGGCQTFNKCEDFIDKTSCQSGLLNCFWNTKSCVQYSCNNAGKNYNTHFKCSEYKADCTVNVSKDGCQDRTCDNAPKELKSNYDCELYKSGCITKFNGGCVKNQECSNITIKEACLLDQQGRECFWYLNSCKLKTCNNAPNVYNSHEQCQTYSKLCTVKKTLNGCVDMSCEAIFQKDNCIVDKLGNNCNWIGLCFDKTCENAPVNNNFVTDAQCKAYLNKCTVRNTGMGCMDRPYQCGEMKIPEQCFTNAYNVQCEWFENSCRKKECYTAPSSLTTFEECNTYLIGCTTTGNGCQPLNTCDQYQNSNSCRFDINNDICQWNNGTCANKSCQTANNTHTTNDLCNTYLSGCIVNSAGAGCIPKPSSCSEMTTATQCTATSTNSSGGPCAWIGSCVDRTCSNAPASTDYDTFTKCNNFLNTCTVVATGTGGCMTMLTSCSSYTSQRQCEQIVNGNKCSWYLTSCLDRQCIYSPDTSSYDDKNECHSYDNRCNVVRRIGGNGCTIRKATCNELSQHQCVKDSAGTICTWNTTADPPYCLNRTCSLTIGITNFTPTNCANWLSTCVVNNVSVPTGCMALQSSCSSYQYSDNCTYTSLNVQCYWNGSSCVNRTCTTTEGITDFDHSSCYTWMNSCTVNKPTTCADKPTNCSDAINYDQCYKNISDQLCAWVGTSCVDRTCNNHGYAVTEFNDINCSGWMPGCSGNPDQTACEITRTCTNHGSNVTTFTHNDCSNWSPLCTVNSTNDACIERTCKNYESNVTDFTDSNCSNWLFKCGSNDDHTACISSRTCSNHGSAITVFNHNNCNAWWDECTVSGTSCTQKTCYNHSITVFNHNNCNDWYYQCTVSVDQLSCQPKTCANAKLVSYTSNNCYQWLNTCTANSNNTACISKRTCSLTDLTTFNYQNCVNWFNECTYTNAGQCNDKTCTNHSSNVTVYSHVNCEAWLQRCTYVSGSQCSDKTCYNYNDFVYQQDHISCNNWLGICTSNGTTCEPKTCTNHGSNVTVFSNSNCKQWLSYCQVNVSGTACENMRGCSPSLSTYTHITCESYNYLCTNNGSGACKLKSCLDTQLINYTHEFCQGYLYECTVKSQFNGCEQKTCYNHGIQVSQLSHANCETWLSNCTYTGSSKTCIPKSCTNHGSNVTVFNNTNCQTWWSACVANSSGTACVNIRTCSNTSLTTYTHQSCENWLSTCTYSNTTSCQDKTCTLASTNSNLIAFDPISCEIWMNTCTSNVAQSACINKTCTNHGDQVTTFNNANCSAWLSYCVANSTNSGCIENKTCSNAVVSSYNNTNCNAWLSTCTVNSTYDGCIDKTCYNYGQSISSFTHTNCNNWLSSCTNLSNTGCQDKTCTNITPATYTSVSCYTWLSYCTGNDTQTACVSTKTCTNYGTNIKILNHTNCNNWLSSCTINSAGTSCEEKSCSNASPTLLSFGPYNDSTCNTWLSTCTVNSTFNGCITRTCNNIPSYITKNTSNCQSWSSLCTYNSSSQLCEDKTCTNHGVFTLNASNCSSWLSTCSFYSNSSDCESIRTCSNFVGSVSHSNCEQWLSTCTRKTDNSGCTYKLCEMYTTIIGTPSSQSDCETYLQSCKYDNSNGTCIEKNCTNFSGSPNQSNCEAWSTRCTVNISNNGCTFKTSSNAITSLIYTDSNCKKWSEAWSLKSTNDQCISSCYNNGQHFSVFNHANCVAWDPNCTVNSNNTNCTPKTCDNFNGTINFSNCQAWLSTCTSMHDNSKCMEKTCNNQNQNISACFGDSGCQGYKSDCYSQSCYSCRIKTCYDFTDTTLTNCQSRYSHCLLGQQSCITHRTCSNHGSNVTIFTHINCENWLSSCTVNDSGTGCTEKTCYNSSITTELKNAYSSPSQITDVQCVSWNYLCTNNSTTGCKNRQCSDSGAWSTCSSYLNSCKTVSSFNYCDYKTCGSATSNSSVTQCKNWLPHCTRSQSQRACHSQRTCSDYGDNIKIFNHVNCEQWNPLCTVNGTNDGCIYKTCFNHGMTSTNNTKCGQWLTICKANASLNGCELKTCTNYGSAITGSFSSYCSQWLGNQCTHNTVTSAACIPQRTCLKSYNGYNIKYDQYYCLDWLTTCTPNQSQTGCIDKTCTNHGSEVTTFTHSNCYNWYDICTNDGSTACKYKTCQNHGSNVSSLSHSNCQSWLTSCTFQLNESTCNYKTCTNYQSMGLTQNNCYNWNNQCTYITYDCEYKTCSNYSGTINESNCRNWLPYCTPNYSGTKCISTRNCSNYGNQITEFNLQTCQNWLPYCTVNSTDDGCMDKTCDNYGSQLSTFTKITCSGWLPYCTNNSTTKCEMKHCTNYPTGYTINSSNCSSWFSYCKLSPTSSNCEYKTCSNHSLSTFNHTNCSNWLHYCTVSDDGTSCVTSRTCTNHGSQVTVFNHSNCQFWLSTCTINSGLTACEPKTCTNHGSFVTTFNHNNCQDWNFDCTVNVGNTACTAKTCANATGISFNHTNCQNWLSICTVNSGNTACIDKTCSNTTGISIWSHNNCEKWLSQCQLNKPTTCTTLQSNCSNAGVSYNQCVIDSSNYECAWYNGTCLRRTCSNYTGTTFTHTDCENWLETCTVESGASPNNCVNKPTNCTDTGVTEDQCVTNISLVNCVWLSGCENRTCANYNGVTFTHSDCETWLSTCTVDALNVHAGCVIKPQKCSMISNQDQCIKSLDNTICFWTGTQCKDRVCEDATQNTTFDDDTECKTFLSTCTVARIGECITKATNCSDYLQESHCFKNTSQGICFWNVDINKCADIKCSNAPTSYTTHTQCNDFLSTCTAKQGGGCMTLNGCLNYSAELSCVIGSNGDICAWSGGRCYVKSCYTAAYDSTRDTHVECQDYLSDCTVIDSGIGGCVPLQDCATYISERQCVINNMYLPCGWDGIRCMNKSCQTAPKSYTQHEECQSYLNECTTVAIGNGCQFKNTYCEQYQTEKQCIITISNQSCYWNTKTNSCEIRSCQNAPDTSITAELCEQHYQFCYTDYVYCRLQKCSDLIYQTNDECKKYNSNCTSNGKTCIDRKLCSDVHVQESCNTDIHGNECQWNFRFSYCVNKSCTTSPEYNITERDCQEYYPKGNCTTRLGGGCIQKSTCENAQLQAACTTSADNKLCIWDSYRCREQICDDILGTSEQECAIYDCAFQNSSIFGIRCTTKKKCSEFVTEDICLKGIDGICKWLNNNCYLYTGCNTISSQYDQICKSLSKNCTTDGNKCVGLSKCADYSIQQSCVTGLDGDCIWWESLGECKRFLACYDLPYLSHQECYQTSQKCTTDTLNGCIPLLLCSSYKYQEQCRISSNGKVIKQNSNQKYITQTGICIWDNILNECKDQSCEQLFGETHEACNAQLYGCTSDSNRCVTIKECEDYDNEQTCLNAQSSNGKCVYQKKQCKTISCNDIPYGYTHDTCLKQLPNCISDGQLCVAIDVCANYVNKFSCNYGGLDGICAWDGYQCLKVLECSDSDLDKYICQKLSEKCKWIENPQITSDTSCFPLECQDLQERECHNIYNIDDTQIKLCTSKDGKCIETEPDTYNQQQCRINTLNTFYWNTTTQKCTQCSNSINIETDIKTNNGAMLMIILIIILF